MQVPKKNLTTQDVQRIARLARLHLSAEEVEVYTPQLSAVLDYFKKLDEVDTTDIKPTYQSIPSVNRFQEQDLESDTLSQGDVLKNAPEKKDGYIVTKGVFDN